MSVFIVIVKTYSLIQIVPNDVIQEGEINWGNVILFMEFIYIIYISLIFSIFIIIFFIHQIPSCRYMLVSLYLIMYVVQRTRSCQINYHSRLVCYFLKHWKMWKIFQKYFLLFRWNIFEKTVNCQYLSCPCYLIYHPLSPVWREKVESFLEGNLSTEAAAKR